MATTGTPMYPYDNTAWGVTSNLLAAIKCQNVADCAKLLRLGADVDQVFQISSVSKPAICCACERGSIEIVQLLLSCNCAVNRQDSNGSSALHVAIDMGHDSIVSLLLRNRASVTIVDKLGNTPLHLAARRGNFNVVQQLVSRGADIHRTDSRGNTALGCACLYIGDNTEMVQFLLSQGANAHETNVYGISVLWDVLYNPGYNYDTVKLLIDSGAKPDLLPAGKTAPIHLVIENNCNLQKYKTLDLMLKKGCDVNTLNRQRQTPLHIAVYMNDLESVRILLRANANPNTTDSLGITPLHYAIKFRKSVGMTEIRQLLLSAGARIPVYHFDKLKLDMDEDENDALREQLGTPMKLTEIARKGLCQRFGSFTYDWICKYGKSEIPHSLLAFSKYESE